MWTLFSDIFFPWNPSIYANVIFEDSSAFDPKVPKFRAHLGSVAKSDIGWSAVLIPVAKYSSLAISAKFWIIDGSFVAAKPNWDGHFE